MSSEDDDMDSDYRPDTPEEVVSKAALPSLSLKKYNYAYDNFQKWNKLHGATPVTEDVLMKYFLELDGKHLPPTLWATYSMLKATLRSKDDLDIGSYSKLLEFLKKKRAAYTPVKTKMFTEEQIEKFINEAPDEQWLDAKVFCIFGANGAYSSTKLVNVMVDHVKQYDNLFLVTISKTDTSSKRTFTITGSFFTIVQKYASLRPLGTLTDRFFLQYSDGKCGLTPIGKGKFCEMPRKVAKFLKLPKPELYSGNSFRICSTSTFVSSNAWKRTTVVPEKQIEQSIVHHSLDHGAGNFRPPVVSYSSPSVSAASNKNGHKNGNATSNKTDHVCTTSCGMVKCALEENERSVFHAFTVMKPAEYTITEVTPAVFASDPTCRWIVAYTHNTEAVTPFNADETFEDITTSIPNNVRINQKYVRGNTSQLKAAYVVVYGVNCKCRRESSSEIFSFSVNEIKYEV